MTDTPDETTRHRRSHPQPMVGQYLEWDLGHEIDQLHLEAEWTTGQNAKTLVKYEDLRVVLTVLRAHARMPSHQTGSRITIQTVRGHLQVRAAGRTFDLRSGNMLALDGSVGHDVEALEDSALLLTIAWRKS